MDAKHDPLEAEEVRGKNFLALDIGLPVQPLRQSLTALRHDSGGPIEIIVDATNRRGRPIKVRVVCSHTGSPDRESRGVVVVMQELDPAASGYPSTHVM